MTARGQGKVESWCMKKGGDGERIRLFRRACDLRSLFGIQRRGGPAMLSDIRHTILSTVRECTQEFINGQGMHKNGVARA